MKLDIKVLTFWLLPPVLLLIWMALSGPFTWIVTEPLAQVIGYYEQAKASAFASVTSAAAPVVGLRDDAAAIAARNPEMVALASHGAKYLGAPILFGLMLLIIRRTRRAPGEEGNTIWIDLGGALLAGGALWFYLAGIQARYDSYPHAAFFASGGEFHKFSAFIWLLFILLVLWERMAIRQMLAEHDLQQKFLIEAEPAAAGSDIGENHEMLPAGVDKGAAKIRNKMGRAAIIGSVVFLAFLAAFTEYRVMQKTASDISFMPEMNAQDQARVDENLQQAALSAAGEYRLTALSEWFMEGALKAPNQASEPKGMLVLQGPEGAVILCQEAPEGLRIHLEPRRGGQFKPWLAQAFATRVCVMRASEYGASSVSGETAAETVMKDQLMDAPVQGEVQVLQEPKTGTEAGLTPTILQAPEAPPAADLAIEN